jgi:hypothetical protein
MHRVEPEDNGHLTILAAMPRESLAGMAGSIVLSLVRALCAAQFTPRKLTWILRWCC